MTDKRVKSALRVLYLRTLMGRDKSSSVSTQCIQMIFFVHLRPGPGLSLFTPTAAEWWSTQAKREQAMEKKVLQYIKRYAVLSRL